MKFWRVGVCVGATSKEAKVEMELAEMESLRGAEENSLISGGEQRWRSN